MRRLTLAAGLFLGIVSPQSEARAQLAPELSLFENPGSSLGDEIGASGTAAFQGSPGGGDGMVGGRLGSAIGRVPYRVAQPGGLERLSQGPAEILPGAGLKPAEAPAFGTLDLPAHTGDDGPEDGLTLDQAIELLVQQNLELRAQAMELPQADADILTAGLRANPLLYVDAAMQPYGSYHADDKPGGPQQYDANISVPLDVTRKRRARVVVAVQAKRVLHAQYQDAVRNAIDNVYTAYVDVLAARETVRFATASVAGLNQLYDATKLQLEQAQKSQAEVNQMQIQRDAASLGLVEAEAALIAAKQELAVLLNIPHDAATYIEVRGSLYDTAESPPSVEELIPLAIALRPDLAAYRLGTTRAQADVQLARANWMQDVYLMYQPFTLQDNKQFRDDNPAVRDATSWGVGLTVNVPLFDRNQGNIRRAQLNVTQTRLELAALERVVASDVRRAAQEFHTTKTIVERLEKDLLPAAQRVLASNRKLYQAGETDMFTFLVSQREHNELVRQYRDALVSHRRAMLKLNTAVGQRLLP